MKTESINNGSIACCHGMPAVPVETTWAGARATPLFWTRKDGVCQRRWARSEEGGISRDRVRERERGERRILLPLNALSPSSPRAAGKSTSDFSPSARVAVATWDHCRHGVLSNCRLTKSWVSTPRSASRRSISGDQAVSPTESLTEEAQSDWELVFSRTANVFNLRNLTFLKSRQASTLLRHAPCQDRRQTGPDLETADETGVCGVF